MSVDALHPPHDPAPPDLRPVTVLAEWAPGTFDSILRLRPDGTRHDVAHLPGPTSVRSAPDGRGLVATTTGGLLTGGTEPARLVHIDPEEP